MLIMEEELVPNKSYAGFVLGEDIHKYLGSNRIYDIQIIDGTIKVKNYVFYDPEISIDTICSKIQNIDCEKTCYWQGKNLIGMCYKDFLEMVKILPDEKDKLIEKISVTLPIHSLGKPTINELSTLIKSHPGNSLLYFRVVDGEHNVSLNLFSQRIKLEVTSELVNYLKDSDTMDFRIN